MAQAIQVVPGVATKAAALVVDRVASEDILRGDFVSSTSVGHVGLSTQDGTLEEALVLGMALNDALTLADVEVEILGVISDPLFSPFSPQEILFLDTDGAVTNTRPTTGKLVIVGRALGDDEILIDIQPPVTLS